MAMAPHPSREVGTPSGPRRGVVRTTVVDTSPRQTIALRQLLTGVLWDANKALLNVCELFVMGSDNEAGWKVLRKAILDIVNAEEQQMRMVVQQIMALGSDLEGPDETEG